MFVDITCSCAAQFNVDDDGDNSNVTWLLVHRFCNAHQECGFMTPVVKDEKETPKRKVVRTMTEEDDE